MVGMDLGEACRCLLTAAILGSNSGLRLTQEKSQTTHASVCVLFPATTVGAYYAVSSQGVGECPHSRRADLPVSAVALPVVSEFCCYAPTIVY